MPLNSKELLFDTEVYVGEEVHPTLLVQNKEDKHKSKISHRNWCHECGCLNSNSDETTWGCCVCVQRGSGGLLKKGIPRESIIVPTVASNGQTIQFGATIVLENSFPVHMPVSDVLCMISRGKMMMSKSNVWNYRRDDII
jgi:hypothetical protein